MHAPWVGKTKKPRTYRQKARKDYLVVAKQKKSGYKKVRKAIGKQLCYLRRNLKNIDKMASKGLLMYLNKKQYRNLLVIKELFCQQLHMYENCTHTMADRIVSISQPHIRPIVRGKAKNNVEFGAKVSISVIEGFSFVDRISWNSYNESGDLIEQIENIISVSVSIPNLFMRTRSIVTARIASIAKNMEFGFPGRRLADRRK